MGANEISAEANHLSRHKTGEAARPGKTFILEVFRSQDVIKVSAHQKDDGAERTLRLYESLEAAWEQVEQGRREILALLNRANRLAKVTPEIVIALKKSGHHLFDLLLPPKAKDKIIEARAGHLMLFVDDKLVHLPWELLFDGERFLCRRFAMGRIVSTQQPPTSGAIRSLKAPLTVLVIGDPRGDLAAAYGEGIAIRNFLDRKRETFQVDFKSAPADVAFVKKNLRDYDIVHYAGHAAYHTENPAESGWLLKDGRLKASEISAMGGLQPLPFLIFSNACQSGHSGEWRIGEEYEKQIFGLANAYLLAGVQHYIGTFWDVLDEPSCHFANHFYGAIAGGSTVGEAVRSARERLIDGYGEETIIWASYMLYGDPTFKFVPAAQADMAETVAPPRETAEWSHATRSEAALSQALAISSVSRWSYAAFGVLLLVVGLLGYRWFQQSDSGPSKEMPVRNPTTAAAQPSAPQSAEKSAAPLEGGQEQVARKDAAPAAVAAPLTVSMNIIGQRKEADGSYSEVIVNEGSVLRSHDNFQIHLEANRPAYIYALIYDSQGKAEKLFPDPKIDGPAFVQAGQKAVIPRRDLWFWLDEHAGTETIYVLASEKPMSDIQRLLAKMQTADEMNNQRASQALKERIIGIQRGVGGITKGQAVTYTLTDGKKIQKVTDVVTGSGAVVRSVSFLHR